MKESDLKSDQKKMCVLHQSHVAMGILSNSKCQGKSNDSEEMTLPGLWRKEGSEGSSQTGARSK